MQKLEGKNIKVVLKNNYIFSGKVIRQDELFITLLDDRTKNQRLISIGTIENLEIKEGDVD